MSINDSGGWSDGVALKELKRKQEFKTGKEVAKKIAKKSGPALGKEAKQYWTMSWIIASQGLEKGSEIIPNNAVNQS